MSSVSLVIARYDEDLSWADKINVDKFIYNKGIDEIENSIKLNNIGLEPHTFLYHIVNNYNNLSDHTFFLQGRPHDHYADIENKILEYVDGKTEDFELIGYPLTEHVNDWNFTLVGYKTCFGYDPNFTFYVFKPGGQFVVSKEKILSNPIEFYQYLYNCYYLDQSDPLYVVHGTKNMFGLPHVFERFWSKVFGEENGV
jgi:hypothetical protein